MSESASPIVLCVDDDTLVLHAIARVLRRLRVDTRQASSGDEALEIMRRESVTVIITDANMPGMDGVELLERVSLIAPETSRFMMTSEFENDRIVAAVHNGTIQMLLRKPWSNELVLAAVAESTGQDPGVWRARAG